MASARPAVPQREALVRAALVRAALVRAALVNGDAAAVSFIAENPAISVSEALLVSVLRETRDASSVAEVVFLREDAPSSLLFLSETVLAESCAETPEREPSENYRVSLLVAARGLAAPELAAGIPISRAEYSGLAFAFFADLTNTWNLEVAVEALGLAPTAGTLVSVSGQRRGLEEAMSVIRRYAVALTDEDVAAVFAAKSPAVCAFAAAQVAAAGRRIPEAAVLAAVRPHVLRTDPCVAESETRPARATPKFLRAVLGFCRDRPVSPAVAAAIAEELGPEAAARALRGLPLAAGAEAYLAGELEAAEIARTRLPRALALRTRAAERRRRRRRQRTRAAERRRRR